MCRRFYARTISCVLLAVEFYWLLNFINVYLKISSIHCLHSPKIIQNHQTLPSSSNGRLYNCITHSNSSKRQQRKNINLNGGVCCNVKIEISVQKLDKTDSKSVIIEVKVNCNWNLQKCTPDKHFQRVKISFEDSITFYLQNILQNLKGVSETARRVGKKKKNYIFFITFKYIFCLYLWILFSCELFWFAPLASVKSWSRKNWFFAKYWWKTKEVKKKWEKLKIVNNSLSISSK